MNDTTAVVLLAVLGLGLLLGFTFLRSAPAAPMHTPPSEGFTIHIDAERHIETMPNMVVHHYCKPTSEGVIQCLLFDSEEPNARLIGTETVVSAEIYQSLTTEEQQVWHYHREEIPQVNAALPDLSAEEAESLVASLQETYGKVVIFWHPADAAPVGDPTVSEFHLE